ncbi:hypothetical protein MF4836_29660 [Pseudomonas sp. MF4836]|nr:hypothetical protein MF4836_29660 [Pseudomonas sp. MF4836]
MGAVECQGIYAVVSRASAAWRQRLQGVRGMRGASSWSRCRAREAALVGVDAAECQGIYAAVLRASAVWQQRLQGVRDIGL